MLKVILNRTLSDNTSKIEYATDLKVQQQYLDMTNPLNHYSEYEHSTKLVKPMTHNNFINTALAAYNGHIPWRIRPDDLQMVLQMAFATCFNNMHNKRNCDTSDHKRNCDILVEHASKMKLSVANSRFDVNYFCDAFNTMMRDNIKDPTFIDAVTTRYTTTTPLLSTVGNMILMNTLKEYFSFEMVLSCGIPAIMMEGTLEDWHKLKAFYEYFKNFFQETELKTWFTHFDIIMDMFMEMRHLKDTDEDDAEAPDHIKELWKRVISYVPEGSGGDTVLGGWIRLLVPYTEKNQLIGGLDRKIKCLDISTAIPTIDEKNCIYKEQDILKDFYVAGGWNTMQTSYVTTPVDLIIPQFDGDKTYKVELYAGFFNPVIYTSIGGYMSVGSNVGFIMREDSVLRKQAQKEEYIKMGVRKKSRGGLDIPITLKKQWTEILASFDECSCTWYVINLDEKIKFYLENGVKKTMRDRTNRSGSVFCTIKSLEIPEKLRPNADEIFLCFDIGSYEKDKCTYYGQPLEKVGPNYLGEPLEQIEPNYLGEPLEQCQGQAQTIVYYDI